MMVAWAKCFAVVAGTISAVGSRHVAAFIVLMSALALRAVGQRRLILGSLVPAYAVGRLLLNSLAEMVKEESEKHGW